MPRKAGRAAEAASLDPPALFRRLKDRRGLVLAVSGGPDSTALMLLVARWADRPPVLAATVDHGLRPESAHDAETVAENAAALGLPWRVLAVPEPFPGGNLQDWARRVRYGWLVTAAREAGFDTIVTAHHREDQAETFLLRLARGSGVYGLAGMPRESRVDGVELVRPLIDVPRRALAEIAADSGLPVADDPSNADPRFDRVRMRSLMPQLAAHGLTAERLAETAARLGRAGAALDHYAGRLIAERFEADRYGRVGGPARALAEVPEEVALRALALILKAVGGAEYTPRLESVEALRRAVLDAGGSTALRRTLHGVEIAVKRGRLIARREWGREGLSAVPAPPGATLLWDRRFCIQVPRLGGALGIAPLGRSDRRLSLSGADRAALRVLPGLFREGTLMAVPRAVRAEDRGAPLEVLSVRCVVGEGLGIPPPA